MTLRRRVVATDKLLCVEVNFGGEKTIWGCILYLSEHDFFGPQLSEERFELGTTYVIIEGTEVELAGCAV
jgi:hypothetical protein